jgi:8-oxo-dGTP pyrophosphatase MutT (NUDIX family)
MSQARKVYAYITNVDQLLVFCHVGFPEAGLQVPGGTIEPGEEPAVAVMREAFEETGLEGLSLVSYLGCAEWCLEESASVAVIQRHFFHLRCHHGVPRSWQHYERHPSEGPPEPLLFEFYWLPIQVAFESLSPYYRALLDKLPGGNFRQEHS